MLSTDIRVLEAEPHFSWEAARTPLKFGGVVMDTALYCHVRVLVENRRGDRAEGWGAIFLADLWAWPHIRGGHKTAEALMRSRYVAYVRGCSNYLLQTWHPATRPVTLDLQGEPVRWLGLQVRRVECGGFGDTAGIVEFVARYKVAGRAHRLHEVSRFVRKEGRWFYQEAQIAS